MKSGNTDKAEGKGKELKGKVKESAGRAVGDRDLEASGRADKAEGKVQNKAGDIKKVFNK